MKTFVYIGAIIVIGFCLVVFAISAYAAEAHYLDVRPDTGRAFFRQPTIGYPNYQQVVHDVGQIAMTLGNWGTFGNGYWYGDEGTRSCEFPIHSSLEYLSECALWIGGIVGDDTLVSTAAYITQVSNAEFNPDPGMAGAIVCRSSLRSNPWYDPHAVSEQDFVCAYTDTITASEISGEDEWDNRSHVPLHLLVSQRSYAWSCDFANEFILFDYTIRNLDTLPIKDLFFGFSVRGRVYHLSNQVLGGDDDISGFRQALPAPQASCRDVDSIDFAWCADNDGDPNLAGQWDYQSPRGVTGIRILRPGPSDSVRINYNWWFTRADPALSFGPRRTESFRPFPRDLCSPTGDRVKYYLLSHPEIDYDQMLTATNHVAEGFLPPPPLSYACDIANGIPVFYLLSMGPFNLQPGDSLPVTLAYVAGDNFHVNPSDFSDYFNCSYPWVYYEKLNFSDLADNARWAEYVFDNPGWDTDGDGDAGRFMWKCQYDGRSFCLDGDAMLPDSLTGCCVKEYYRGDGIPDFRPAAPPPPPVVRTIPGNGTVTIRWNGKDSEDYINFLTQEPGFEGYRVYMAQDDRLTDFVMLASYDLDDYVVFRFNPSGHQWEGVNLGITRDSLRELYGPEFEPAEYYDEFHYFVDNRTGNILYFTPQDWNRSDLTDPHGIHKVYPEASPDDPSDVTDEGYLRYYEYEYTIDNLNQGVPYYFAVTAFNKGSFHRALSVMESSPTANAVREYALPSSQTVEAEGLNVIVYPNPYRIDAGYARVGYENRDRTESVEWARKIHFGNLPPICTIRIYTVDGDLVREIKHYYPEGGPGSQHEEWNVISRNTQAITTGIYIWSVRSAMGEQLGKLVIIK